MTSNDLVSIVAEALAVTPAQVEKVTLQGRFVYAFVAGRRHLVRTDKMKAILADRRRAAFRQRRDAESAIRRRTGKRPEGKPFLIQPDGVLDLDDDQVSIRR